MPGRGALVGREVGEELVGFRGAERERAQAVPAVESQQQRRASSCKSRNRSRRSRSTACRYSRCRRAIYSLGSRADADRDHHRVGDLRAARVRGRRSGAGRRRRSAASPCRPRQVRRRGDPPRLAPRPGHVRLSNHVTHRANVWALHELGATAVIGCTACGAVDPTLELGIAGRVRRPALPLQPAAGRLACARSSSSPAIRPAGTGSCTAARSRRGSGRRWWTAPRESGHAGPRRRHLRPRRRSALQHADRDRPAGALRRDRGQPDRRA